MTNNITTENETSEAASPLPKQKVLQNAVTAFYRAHVNVIPPVQGGEKRPYPPLWKKYQTTRPTREEALGWWKEKGLTGVGAVCGKISGNLEALDFDDRQAYEEYKLVCVAAGLGELVERIEQGYLEYSPKGAHWLYRCEMIEGNQKLAKADNETTLIETRGEGGFIIVAPTYGDVNPKGDYKPISGGPETIVTITPDERDALLAVARSLCKLPKKQPAPLPKVVATSSPGTSPFDDYAQKTSWAEILGAAGWTMISEYADKTSWRRPGKDKGVSATTFGEDGVFYCFTSSTSFEAEQSYTKAGVYAHLHHGDDFKAAAKALSLLGYGSREKPNPEQPGAPESDDAKAIKKLAALTPIEYDRMRIEQAKQLGIRVGVLDSLVEAERGNSGERDESASFIFPEIEPWPEPVDAAELLTGIASVINRVAKLPQHSDTAIALWVLFTYCIGAFFIAPILNVTSPEKRCGKSTVLGVLQKLVYKAIQASNITSAALFRSIDAWAPTLIIDEADTFVTGEKEELRGIINSGHNRDTAYVIRAEGDDHEPTQFTTWCAKCMAGIGHLPDTVKDRSIIIVLRRKLTSEKVEKLRHIDDAIFEELVRKCVRFAQDNMQALRIAKPDMPEALNDRAMDNWEPLFAIADLAGGDWPKLSRNAALALAGVEKESISTNVELLRDIKDVFDSDSTRDSLFTHELVTALTADEESPWATWNRGKPISPRQIATRVKEFGAVAGSIRINGRTAKGYKRESFEDAFTRYIPPVEETSDETKPQA